jgi:outer membrane protein OmpA-like peptidoglycan-associated protein
MSALLLQRKCGPCEEKKKLQRKPASEGPSPQPPALRGRFAFDSSRIPVLRRTCACGGTCGDCKEKKELRRTAAGTDTAPAQVPPIVHDVLRSSGRPLDASSRAFFEPRFGRDLSAVRIHDDAPAAASARAVDALAYTFGNDIVLRSAPTSSHADRRLLAHELAHTIQQENGPAHTQMAPEGVGGQDDPAETEADQTADAVMRGKNAAAPVSPTCPERTDKPASVEAEVTFKRDSSVLSPTAKTKIAGFLSKRHAAGTSTPIRVDGYASTLGTPAHNLSLSCARAEAVRNELESPTTPGATGVPAGTVQPFAHGETTEFDPAKFDPNQRATIANVPAPTPAPTPKPAPPPPPACPAVPATNPGSCSGRHKAYCDAVKCFPSDPWLTCACTASDEVCQAADAFSFTGVNGALLDACVNFPSFNALASAAASAKAGWLLFTNSCIWNHWRAAFEALHAPALPLPSGLTPEWSTAVTTCRTSGAGSKACCNAQVVAEQNAIDRCGPYKSSVLGKSPYEIPGAPVCSAIVKGLAPPPLFPSSSDFGVVADRIAYGQARCCP